MSAVAVERRVSNLETLMTEVWRTIEQSQRRIEQNFERLDRQLDRTDRQIEATQRLVEATQRQVEATQRQVEATQRQVDQTSRELCEFKKEMQTFREEMQAFREEERASRREMNKKWGELANKMGTMAEDLVAPSVPRILRETVGCPDGRVDSMAVRVHRLHPADRSREREFDVVAVCGDYVLINETRSTLTTRHVEEFVQRMPEAREFFPEYAAKKFIGAVASLYVDESVVRCGERQGVIVLGFGEDVMEVLNAPGFVPTAF